MYPLVSIFSKKMSLLFNNFSKTVQRRRVKGTSVVSQFQLVGRTIKRKEQRPQLLPQQI
jgi:hypothetical protein